MTSTRFIASQAAREAIHFIQAAPKVYLTVHIVPDGDSVGSALGLYWGLLQLSKQVRVACADPLPDSFVFLPGSDIIKAHKPASDELIVILDSSDLQRLGSIYELERYQNRPLINIDHHVTNVRFGSVNWIEPKAASTAEIIVDLLSALGVALNADMATCLLTGIATDTLTFRTSSTTPELMETAAQLMRAGAPLSAIIEKTFNTRELSDLQLQGAIVANMHVENGLIWSDNTRQMRREAGAHESGGSGTGTLLLSAKSARISVIFIERDKHKVEVSFRTRPGYDISSIAFSLGGGGHPQAAGCTLNVSLDEAHQMVLPAVRALLNSHPSNEQRSPQPE